MQQLSAIIDKDMQVVTENAGERTAGFGAQVACGPKLGRPDAASAARLRELLARYQVLVFRDQAIAPEAQLALTRLLGDPEPGISRRPASHQVAGFPGVLRLHNRPGSQTLDYGQSWHSDGLAYARMPHGVTMLSCKACPENVGDTLFASQALAYAAMPERLRAEIADRRWLLPLMPFSEVPPDKELTQPLVRRNEVTDRRFVFCAPNAQQILGLSATDSADLLARVRRYQLSPGCQYRHRWRPGDLVIWENSALLHNRADVVDYRSQGLREMYRTATLGTFRALEIDCPS